MKLYSENKNYKLYNGNMLDMLEVIEEQSIDSIVCDPPYELNFMSNDWDNSGIAFSVETWLKCYQVLKPGGYLLAFGGSRTYHRIACAIEDAGFEIRDTIMWLYGSGFPKSMNIGKGIESKEKLGNAGTRNKRKIEQSCATESYTLKQTNNGAWGEIIETTRKEYIPGTELSKKWDGWGTCLKPSFEPIIVARKPFKGSLVDNVIKYGVGGINIDECRVGNDVIKGGTMPDFRDIGEKSKEVIGIDKLSFGQVENAKRKPLNDHIGRFPANTILTYDESDFDEVCGGMPDTKSAGGKMSSEKFNSKSDGINVYNFGKQNAQRIDTGYIAPCDSGSASRYFYCAKASKKDRDEGLDEFEEIVECDRNEECYSADVPFNRSANARKNTHPTVKPTELMQYLVRLVSPNGATILDPFNGSGSTGKAVMYENKERNKNYKYIGIELTEEYLPIAKARIEYACNMEEEKVKNMQMSIYDFDNL